MDADNLGKPEMLTELELKPARIAFGHINDKELM
jgi:hypothetical protein